MDIKCLTKAPGHIPSPEHLRCTLAFCRNKRCSSKTHFLIWCFDDDGGDRCNTMVHMLKDFRIAKASHYDSHRFCAAELSKSVNPLRQRTLTQSDTPYICPILDFFRIIHHRMKRSTRTTLSQQGSKCPPQLNKSLRWPTQSRVVLGTVFLVTTVVVKVFPLICRPSVLS